MPGTYATPDDPPFWIRHGDADATIPYTDSVTFADQLTDAGVPVVDFEIVPGQGHGFTGEAKAIADAEAWAFMDQHVKNLEVTTPILYRTATRRLIRRILQIQPIQRTRPILRSLRAFPLRLAVWALQTMPNRQL